MDDLIKMAVPMQFASLNCGYMCTIWFTAKEPTVGVPLHFNSCATYETPLYTPEY